MPPHRTTCRVIYGDTDTMGVAYHANYLRWFEIGRTELFRDMGLAYRELEANGIRMPVSEVHCKYISAARYDDALIIETRINRRVRAGMKFDYRIFRNEDETLLVEGWSRHAFIDTDGRVIRPPAIITRLLPKSAEEMGEE